jgi:hypothetical protein
MSRIMQNSGIGLVLFVIFAVAVGNYQRTADATIRFGDILSISSSTGNFLKFSLDDSPLVAATVVATSVPFSRTDPLSRARQTHQNMAFMLLGGIFSVLIALNLAFIGHLRREYASPRRGTWGRGQGSVENP